MVKCGYCGSTIFGGVRDGNQSYCNAKCRNNAYILSVSKQVPPDVLEKQIEEIFRGNCPKCRGLGPIDVHKVHQVWSALILTRWTTNAQVSCRSCGTKSQLGGALFSFALGWWGFPWGFVLTPVQITRNVVGMVRGPDPSKPSDDLRKLVQVNIGLQMLQKQRLEATKNPPPMK